MEGKGSSTKIGRLWREGGGGNSGFLDASHRFITTESLPNNLIWGEDSKPMLCF